MEMVTGAITRRNFLRTATSALALSTCFSPSLRAATDKGADLTKLPPRTPITRQGAWTIQNKIIHLNDKPFFPIGIYHDAHKDVVGPDRIRDVKIMSDIGLNMIHTPVDSKDKDFLDAAAKAGVYVAFEANDDQAIERLGKHPAVAFLSTMDDVAGKDPQAIYDLSQKIHRLAPNTLTYSSCQDPNVATQYAGITDLIAQQSYPVPFEPIIEGLHNWYMKGMRDAAEKYGKRFIANLQTFRWPDPPAERNLGKGRYPTQDEVRQMTYLAIAQGVHGIIYYSWRVDGLGTDLSAQEGENREMYLALKRCSYEINTLTPYLVGGTENFAQNAIPEAIALCQRTSYANPKYKLLIACSLSDDPKEAARTFDISLGGMHQVQELFLDAKGTSGKTTQASSIKGEIPFGAVRVFELK